MVNVQENVKIKDFGAKIGGARKDLWKDRGLMVSDLECMNDAEIKKHVKKVNVWKRPDYDAMIQDGAEIEAAYALKMVYDAIPTSPYTSSEKYVNGFIEFVQEMKEAYDGVKTWNDVTVAGKEFIQSHTERQRYSVTPLENCYGLMTNKLYKALCLSSYDKVKYSRKIKTSQFGVPKEEKLPAGYSIMFYDGNGYSRDNKWIAGTYYITKKYQIVEINFPTKDAAMECLKLLAEEKKTAGKKRFTPPQLSHICREGLADNLNGRHSTGDDFLRDFRILGGEFGEWMSEKDSQVSMDMAYEALCDFADVLGIPKTSVAFGNRLSIAFGSRGHGSAVAHYEPDREVINLTKMRGAGSLGHELFHALDDICGKKLGLNGFVTGAPSYKMPESVRKVLDVMKYRPATVEEETEAMAKVMDRKRRNLKAAVVNALCDREKAEKFMETVDEKLKSIENTSKACAEFVNELSAQKKEETGRIIKKDEREILGFALYSFQCDLLNGNKPVRETKMKTDFLVNSEKMDQCSSKEKNGYWASDVEMFARAGACYLKDVIREIGEGTGRSDYLCGHADCAVSVDADGKIIYAYPRGEERKRINEAMKEMIDDFKVKGIL